MQRIPKKLKAIWNGVRFVLGDAAYDRYLAHWYKEHNADGGCPLDRKAFFQQELNRKWNSGDIQRCC